MKGRLAVFFVYVWPEPRSSAAGVRTYALIRHLLEAGWEVAAISPSNAASVYKEELEALGVRTFTCDPNSSAATDGVFCSLHPELVIFDRFVMEEQFGWRARESWPEALQIVDTQDLHSVRRARERRPDAWESPQNLSLDVLGEDLLRELASLHRVDAAFVVSQWEYEFLLARCRFPAARLLCLPFPGKRDLAPAPFSSREGFAFLGNFRHPPNLDSVRWLEKDLWPRVRALLPHASLHLYGSYPPAEVSRHKGHEGIFAHGPVTDHRAALAKHRALLAPLRFGAGIKGKVLEAWGTGTPVVGNALTFEGMGDAGLVAGNAEGFASFCRELHENEGRWLREQARGFMALQKDFFEEDLARNFHRFVEQTHGALPRLREENLVGRMLAHHNQNSTKYFSRWIEEKNRGKPAL